MDFLDRRCPGGHAHVRVEGSYTKASAVYVDGLAWHLGLVFHKALRAVDAVESLAPDVSGLESPLANDIMLASRWSTVRAWFWKRTADINVLELCCVELRLCRKEACLGTFCEFPGLCCVSRSSS